MVAEHNISICSLTPSIMAMLLRLFPKGSTENIKSVRHAFCGTAPLPADIWQSFEKCFGFPVFQGYGLTETTTWVTATPYLIKHRYDSVGVPLGGEIIFDPLNKKSDVEDGKVVKGEILVKAPTVMLGYYNQQKLTDSSFKNGYLKTGDLGYFNDDGELHISGRKKEIIIRNGININPVEIDQSIRQYPGIIECKTVGLIDSMSGESIVTACVPIDIDNPPDGNKIKQWVHEHKSAFYCPDKIVFMGYLPKGTTGKVKIKELKKILNGDFVDDVFSRFNQRKYRRAQPSCAESIKQIIHESTFVGKPIRLLMYWGCGKRGSIDDIDRVSLGRIKEMLDNATLLEEVSCQFTIMLNDMHSTVNCVPKEHYKPYYGQIAECSKSHGFDVIYQSDIWEACNLNIDDVIAASTSNDFSEAWKELSIREKLIEQAHKHFRDRDKEQGARQYFAACRAEAQPFADYFSGCAFVTYNGPAFDLCLPNLPKLYIFSHKKGSAVKPWFM